MVSLIRLFYFWSACVCGGVLCATPGSTLTIIESARAHLGTEESLNGMVTLQITGRIHSFVLGIPEIEVYLAARSPFSQHLALRVDDIQETIILNGKRSCMIRSNANLADSHQMRWLSPEETGQMRLNTRNIFNFYLPDVERGDTLFYRGIVPCRGVRSHKLEYKDNLGQVTTRYFSVSDCRLISMLDSQGVEMVEYGSTIAGGIRFPGKVEYYKEGQLLHTLQIEEILVNRPLPEGIFRIPRIPKPKSLGLD